MVLIVPSEFIVIAYFLLNINLFWSFFLFGSMKAFSKFKEEYILRGFTEKPAFSQILVFLGFLGHLHSDLVILANN